MANVHQINIYDDLFTYEEQVRFYTFIKGSMFKYCTADDVAIEHSEDYSMVSEWNLQDVENFGILKNNKVKEIMEELGHIETLTPRVNASFTSDSDRLHVDGGTNRFTMLYYPNLNWNLEWGGHTIFSKDRKKIDKIVEYVPGRLITFPATWPHMVFSPTKLAKSLRFTFAMTMDVS